MRPAPAILAVALAGAALGCGGGEPDPETPAVPAISFETGRVVVEATGDTIPLTVELAETDVQRSYGLMQRDALAEDRGMLFVYGSGPHPPDAGFWMWRTRIPLDVAFLDADGTIVAIRTMEPCDRPAPAGCPSYAAGAPWHDALEVRGGWFGRHGVAVGDRVRREGSTGGAAAAGAPSGDGPPDAPTPPDSASAGPPAE